MGLNMLQCISEAGVSTTALSTVHPPQDSGVLHYNSKDWMRNSFTYFQYQLTTLPLRWHWERGYVSLKLRKVVATRLLSYPCHFSLL